MFVFTHARSAAVILYALQLLAKTQEYITTCVDAATEEQFMDGYVPSP